MIKTTKILLVLACVLGVFVIIIYANDEIFDTLGLSSKKQVEMQTPPSAIETPAPVKETLAGYDATNYKSRINQGEYYLENGFLDFAIDEFQGAIELEPKNTEAYVYMAGALAQKNDFVHAEKYIEQAVGLGDSEFETTKTYIGILLKNGKVEEAKKVFENYDDGQDDEEIVYYRALFGLLDESRNISGGSFTYLTEEYPDSEYAKKAEKFLQAYYEFDLFQDGKPEHLETLLAKSLNEVGEYELAKAMLEKALSKNSEYRDAWIILGYSHYANEDYIDALNAWKKAVELDPTNAEARYFLGLAEAQIGNYEDAVDSFEFAIRNGFQPEGQIKNKLGGIYLEMQDYENSVKNYEEYIKSGGSAEIDNYVRPVWIYLDKIGTDDAKIHALALSQSAVNVHNQDAMAYNLLGWSLIYNEKYTEAYEALEKARELDVGLAATYLNLGRLYEAEGKTDEAKDEYKKAYDMDNGGGIGNLAAGRYNNIVKQIKEGNAN